MAYKTGIANVNEWQELYAPMSTLEGSIVIAAADDFLV
jgi:hypothetical protein